jgi:hypothetical protein
MLYALVCSQVALVNRRMTTGIMWLVTAVIVGVNVHLLGSIAAKLL